MKRFSLNLKPDSAFYEEFRYPAGETQTRIRPEAIPALQAADLISVTAGINNAQDIISLLQLSSALDAIAPPQQTLRLILPYLPYSRADRRFTPGDCFGLKAFGELLGTTAFTSVHTLDVHNEKAAAQCIPNLVNHTALSLVHKSIAAFAHKHAADRITILFPDEGARARYTVPGHLSCNTASIQLDVLHCEKKRDTSTGKFLGFSVPDVDAAQPAIIIDDICDGGGTFLGIAAELAKQHGDWWPANSLGLYVTHGIFSKGFGDLGMRFDMIYTTNTLPERGPNKLVKVYDALPILSGIGG